MSITFVLSLIAAGLMAFSDFAGWTENTYYGQNDYYVFIGSENAPSYATPILIILVICHLASAYASYKGISGNPTKSLGIWSNILAIAITVLGALLFTVLAEAALERWLETSFYASLIASAVGIFLFSKGNTN